MIGPKVARLFFAAALAAGIGSSVVTAGEKMPSTAAEYEALAAKYKPKNADEETKAKAHMELSKAARTEARKRGGDTFDYAAYAVCFYAQLAGGADCSPSGPSGQIELIA